MAPDTPLVRWNYRAAGRGAGISRGELADRVAALEKAPLFAQLPKRHLRAIARVTAVSLFERGHVLVQEDRPGARLFVVLEGRVKVTRRGRTLRRLSAGDFFGEISLLDPGPRTASVVAEDTTVCLTLAGNDFRRILSQEATLGVKVAAELARRLRDRGGSATE